MREQVRDEIAKLEAFIPTVDDALALPKEACMFLHALILAHGTRNVVEVGTSYGYSGLWIAGALQLTDGHLRTIDRDARKLDAASSHFEAAGVSSLISTIQNEAIEALASLDSPVDLLLLDAEKEHCRQFVELALPHLTDRGIIVIDNTLTHAEELRDFLGWLREHDAFTCADIAIGNGLEMAVRSSAD
ncbi:MAG: O-methyltransferase [Phycisphaerae bacterium]